MKLLKESISRFKKLSLSNKLYVITAGFTIILFTLLATASVFLQKDLREQSFDPRKEAAVEGGIVSVRPAHPQGSSFPVNNLVNIPIWATTNQASIDGIELLWEIKPENKDIIIKDSIQIASKNNALEIPKLDIIETDSGYQVKILAISANPERPFNTGQNQNEPFAQLSFFTRETGAITIDDVEARSFAIITGQGRDELDTLEPFTYYIKPKYDDIKNPVSWKTDYVKLSADNFYIETIDGQRYYSTPDVNVSSNPYNPESPDGNYVTLEIGDWTENGRPMRFYMYFYKNAERWWLDHFRTYNGLNVKQHHFYPEMSAPLGEVLNYQAEVVYESEEGGTKVGFTNLNLQPFLQSPYCGNGVCEYSENENNCENDCTASTACPLPTAPEVSAQSCPSDDEGSVSFNWDSSSGQYECNVDFELQLSQNSDFSDPVSYQITDVSQAENLTVDNGQWYARVKVAPGATCCDVTDNWSNTTQFTVECQQEECQYIYRDDWGQCQDGWQEQSFEVIGPESCPDPAWENWHRPCMTQCRFQCGEWSECGADQIQTRDCVAQNKPCWDYVNNRSSDTYTQQRSCGTIQTGDLIFASYEACWYGSSNGESTYVAWSRKAYPEVSYVDISPDKNFENFANKNVKGADLDQGYGITTAEGFTWNGTNDRLKLSPETVYYARLYYRENENEGYRHSRSTTFRIHRCAGDPSGQLQQCNEACSDNSDCTSGLACYNGRCRLPANPSDDDCIDPTSKQGCAEWCADDSECQDQYSCWYNYCRNPNNIDVTETDEASIAMSLDKARETNCADWSDEDRTRNQYFYYTTIDRTRDTNNVQYYTPASEAKGSQSDLASCNEYCASNRTCMPNHRCYQNRCRLAINPESPTCSATNNTKGGSIGDADAINGGTDLPEPTTSSVSPEPASEGIKMPVDPIDDEDSDSPTSQPDESPEKAVADQTAWDAIKQYLQSKDISLPLIIAAGAAGVVLIVIIITLATSGSQSSRKPPRTISNIEKDQSKPNQPRKPSNRNMTSPPSSSMINRMKEKGVESPKNNSQE
jgi:hypothetical protein